jgi:hypothetical protein
VVLTSTPDALGAQFLRLGRKAEVGVGLAAHEHVQAVGDLGLDPLDVLARVEPDVGQHRRHEHVLGSAEAVDGDALALQVADRTHLRAAEQLVASQMDASQDDEGLPGVDLRDHRADGVHRHVRVAGGHVGRRPDVAEGGVVHGSEALGPQQGLGHVLRHDADPRRGGHPQARRLQQGLGGGIRGQADGGRAAQRCGPSQEVAATRCVHGVPGHL